jgi:hypothetical protein
MINGYGSAGWDKFVRRDGSTTLTDDWNVGYKGITNIKNLSADSVAAGSVFAVGTVKGGDGVFGNFLGIFRAALNATTAYFSDSLTVAQTTRLSGDTYLDGKTMASKLRLESESVLGQACVASQETLRRSATQDAVRLLVCDPVSNTWVRAQADYAGQISEIISSIEALGGKIKDVNSDLNDINVINTDFKKRLAKVEDEYMTWDIINVTWDSATYVTTQTGTRSEDVLERMTPDSDKPRYVTKEVPVYTTVASPRSNVWKKTPFGCSTFTGKPDGSGGLDVWDDLNNVRWQKWASDIQKGLAPAGSYTPPIFIGFDETPDEETVYDINCENGSWYVGVSTKASNIAGGNTCRDGLVKPVSGSCRINLNTPSYNKQRMAARFIAFTRKP